MLSRVVTYPLYLLCLGFAAWFVLAFLYIASISLLYPFPLEWMEGHTLDIMQRLLEGKHFYAKPTLEYVPYIYTPYYFYVSALFGSIFGVDFFAARLVSVLSICGVGGILYSWIRKENGNKAVALITVGLFFATYELSSRWFDVARVDSLYLFTMVAGLYVYYFNRTKQGAILAGTIFAAAFFTKQSALIALFPAFAAALWIDRAHALRTAAIAGALIIAGCAALQITSDGWFSFYIYDVPAGHPNDTRQYSLFWTRDLFEHTAIMLGIFLPACFFCWKRGYKDLAWYAAVAIGFVGSAYLSRIHSYGHINVIMPVHFVMALFCGLAITRSKFLLIKAGLLSLAAIQFYLLLYDVQKFTPTPMAEEKGYQFLDEIAKFEGKVLLSEIQFIQTKVGKKNYSIGMAGFDILRSNLGKKDAIKQEYREHIRKAIRNQEFDAVIIGNFIRIYDLLEFYETRNVIHKPQEFITGGVYFNTGKVLVPRTPHKARPPIASK